jgi:hypothetical protein
MVLICFENYISNKLLIHFYFITASKIIQFHYCGEKKIITSKGESTTKVSNVQYLFNQIDFVIKGSRRR